MSRSFLPLLLLLAMLASRPAAAYSVLTHQAQIDSCWRRTLVPVLSARFPGATPEEWKDAKALRLWRRHYSGYGILSVWLLTYLPTWRTTSAPATLCVIY